MGKQNSLLYLLEKASKIDQKYLNKRSKTIFSNKKKVSNKSTNNLRKLKKKIIKKHKKKKITKKKTSKNKVSKKK